MNFLKTLISLEPTLFLPNSAETVEMGFSISEISQYLSEWIGTKFDTDIHGPQKMNPNDSGDPDFSSSTSNRSKFQFVQYFMTK